MFIEASPSEQLLLSGHTAPSVTYPTFPLCVILSSSAGVVSVFLKNKNKKHTEQLDTMTVENTKHNSAGIRKSD